MRAAGWRAPFEASVAVLVCPQRDSAADDLAGGEEAEITSVEAVADLPVHQEDFAARDAAAALPDRQVTSGPITLERRARLDTIDSDGEVRATDTLPGHSKDALQEWHAPGQVAAISEERREWLGHVDGHKIGNLEGSFEVDRVEADRHAGRCVPDQPDRHRREGGIADADGSDDARQDDRGARHGSVLLRSRAARWWSSV
jgi:hypothetical protein